MLVYDNLIFSLQKAGGISTYWGELISRMLRDEQKIVFHESANALNSNIVRNRLQINNDQIIKDRNLPNFINRFLAVGELKYPDRYIFHSSYNRITYNKKAIQVATIHDFIHEKYYKGPRKFLHVYQKNKAIDASDLIIVVSENTKKDLLHFHSKIHPDRIKVVCNGVSNDFYAISPSINLQSRPYIVFIGSREHYKNFDFAVNVVSSLKDFDLYIVGSMLSRKEEKFLTNIIPNRWKFFNNISNSELNNIYNKSYALLYPSSYEGFGIPLLEAMKAGTPFIALNKSSIPEVAGNAGILLDELDQELFVKAILSIELNRQKLVEKGFKQAEKFSWEKCYQETLEGYKELLSK